MRVDGISGNAVMDKATTVKCIKQLEAAAEHDFMLIRQINGREPGHFSSGFVKVTMAILPLALV